MSEERVGWDYFSQARRHDDGRISVGEIQYSRRFCPRIRPSPITAGMKTAEASVDTVGDSYKSRLV